MYIEELDKSPQSEYMFLRPRRWGKSTFLQMLANYYDKTKAGQFGDIFGQFYIGKHPTSARSSFLVLVFDFSCIRTYGDVFESFNDTLNETLRAFLHANAEFLGYPDPKALIKAKATSSLQAVLVRDSLGAQIAAINPSNRIWYKHTMSGSSLESMSMTLLRMLVFSATTRNKEIASTK